MNRYSQITTSEFNPLSFQEIMAAPLAMRQKHDNAIAAAEALRIKANPLDKHLARAVELKQQMDNEIANNVDTLNKEGYNPTTFQNIIKLNRQYQDMISPTGEIGQINNAKVVYDKAQEDFIQDAAKQNIGRDRAINLWKEKTNYYTGFGEDGKSITNVNPQGVAAYQDYTKDKQVAHSILGKTVQGVSSQGHHLEVDKQTGGVWEITRNGKRVKSDNTRQVEAALKSTLDKWDNPNGEGKKWLMDSGDGLNRERIINDFNSMLERSNINDVSENANYNTPITTTTTPLTSSVFGEDYNTQEIGGESAGTSNISKIGEKLYGSAQGYLAKSPVSSYTSANLPLKEKAVYDSFWKRATTGDGIMLDGKLVKLNPSLIKKGKDDPTVASQLLRSIKQSPAITLTSKMLTSNQVIGNQGFIAGLGSTADDFDKNIRRQLQRSDASGRKLIDENGKTLNWNDAVKEYKLSGINDVNYQGYISPLNWEDNLGQGSNSKFSPHVITAKDENGNWHTFKTTRLSSDNLGVNTVRQNEITENYRDATLNYNSWTPIKSNNEKLSKYKVKYNPKETEIDPYSGEIKSWLIDVPNKEPVKVTESDYLNFMNSNK